MRRERGADCCGAGGCVLRYVSGLALLLLVACAARVAPPAPDISLLRDPTAPVGSQADVVAEDLSGDWFVRQGVSNRWPLTQQRVRIARDGDTLVLSPAPAICDEFGPCHNALDQPVAYAPDLPNLPGRWAAQDAFLSSQAGLPAQIWVYWMDFDRRTMVLGDPNSRFVAILDRSPSGGGDRIIAARDILAWYGYDLSQLVDVKR